MLRSSGLLQNLGSKLNRISIKNVNYKLNVNNNYPVLNKPKPIENNNRPHKDLLDTLRTMYLRESKQNQDKTKLFTQLKDLPNKGITTNLDILRDISNKIEPVENELIKQPPDSDVLIQDHVAPSNELIHKAKIQMENLNKSFELLIKKQLEKKQKISFEQLDFDQKHKIFNQKIKSYIDICCNSNSEMLEKAISYLNKLMSESNDKKPYEFISDIEIYNRLMFELAKKGKTSQITYLFKKMRTQDDATRQIKPNLNTFIAVIQSIGHNIEHPGTSKKLKDLKLTLERVLFDIQKSNFSLDDIASSISYSSEQQFYIKKALNSLIPSFEFKHMPISSSNNPLLAGLKEPFDAKIMVDKETYYPTEMVSKTKIYENFEHQLKEEQNLMIEVPSIRSLSQSEKKQNQKNENLKNIFLKIFREDITKAFYKNLNFLKTSSNNPNTEFLYPFLTAMEPRVYIDILIQQIIKLSQNSEYFSASLNVYALELGSILETKYHENLMVKNNDIDKIKLLYEKYIEKRLEKLQNPLENTLNSREQWLTLMKENNLFKNNNDIEWPALLRLKLGRYLLEEILFKACKIDKKIINPKLYVNNPRKFTREHAFHKIYRLAGVYKDPQIKCHPVLFKIFSSNLLFESNRMPMITPPMPWYMHNQGGYFLSKSNLLRIYGESGQEQKNLVESTRPENMYPVYDSLNTLSSCAWKINQPILDLLIDIFNKDGNKELEVPEPEHKGPEVPKFPNRKLSKEEYKELYQSIEKAKKKRAEMHSLWCTELYRLSIANMYRDKVIWFPHSLDFRGRCYPIPPHFNHLGSDISRSLILLAEGKKLGPHGLDMLKLHLINLTGLMKRSTLDERLKYADSIINDIIDSAEKPLTGKLWWKKSEEKWQTLACCIEIRNAIKSGKPEDYISHFPIHQDGSCNGLQHYAALGRDKEGAISVNLHPSIKPQDVYSTVLDIVEEQRKSEEENNEFAKILAGHIKRKTIKQTVMTTVYNVTFYGAKLQILKQLEDLKNFPQDKAREASAYIAHKTFKSIRQLFSSAREIQDWFSECAYLITRVRDCALKWETPLGLPVTQPYFRQVNIHNPLSKYSDPLSTNKPDSLKQRNAFPPNFIHSLDSCHMMLTSLYCERAGITFVSVHDCFWTHASSVDLMNKICREQFVALHSLPLLENLSKFFMDNYKFTPSEIEEQRDEDVQKLMMAFNNKLESVPKKGEFDLNKVLESVYFFS
ncbi:unnamed protein product [Brachionus calyciflorus]|uniref:DNA-directed RNA polymerase n=1 Tax=Brachionus calyciflorus TaxID=104777 RepID=A0A814DUS5_9BILA|nr:unnamed protein product [Brachionus calyciflorus]